MRLGDGRIHVILTVGTQTVLARTVHLTDSQPITLEVTDEKSAA
jgi:hypothetical protein